MKAARSRTKVARRCSPGVSPTFRRTPEGGTKITFAHRGVVIICHSARDLGELIRWGVNNPRQWKEVAR